MSLWSKLGSIFAGGVVETVEKGADIVERWVPGAEKKQELAVAIDAIISDSINQARSNDKPTGGQRTWFDSAVDGVNRLIRPGVSIFLFGGIGGAWELPKVGEIDPIILTWTGTVFLFWFGGRALFKDLPGVIAYLRESKK